MNQPEHDRVGELFLAALELPSSQWGDFVARETGDDEDLAREVLGLLATENDSTRAGALERGVLGGAGSALDAPARLLESAEVRPASSGSTLWPREGQSIGGYRLVRPIGEGGMGVVWVATQEKPARSVALKLMRPALHADTLRRFELEGEALGRLRHPAIASVFEAGVAEGPTGDQPFLALEWIDGEALDHYANGLELDIDGRVVLLERVARGVQHAHLRGVIHRDLKPANILVGDDGQPKILDFGVARIHGEEGGASLVTQQGEIVGTLGYMSPEQISGDPEDVDTRADVYALGVVGYELLSGERPVDVRGASLTEAMRRVVEDAPRPLTSVAPDVPVDLATILHKALEKDPARRYPSVEALADDLGRYQRHEPVEARPPSAMYHATKFVRRHRGAALGAAIALIAILGGAALSTTLWLKERAAAEKARVAEVQSQRALASSRASFENLQRSTREMRDVAEFFEDLVYKALPGEEGKELTLVDALRRSLPDVASGFAERPRRRAWLHATIGQMFLALGELDNARGQFEAAAAVPADLGSHFKGLLAMHESHMRSAEADLPGALAEVERGLGLMDERKAYLQGQLAEEPTFATAQLGQQTFASDAAYLEEQLEEVRLYRMELLLRRASIAAMDFKVEVAQAAFGEIEALLEEGAELDPPANAEIRGRMAEMRVNLLLSTGDLDEAADLAMERIRIADETGRGSELHTQMLRNTLGAALMQLGRREEAIGYVETAFEGTKEMVGAGHPFLARMAGNLGTAKRSVGDLDGALTLYSEALALASDEGPTALRAEATARGNLGSLHLQMENYGAGKEELEQAIELYGEIMLSDKTPSTAVAAANLWTYLAPALRAEGDYEGARELIDRAFQAKLQVVGSPAHPIFELEHKEFAATAAAAGDHLEHGLWAMRLGKFYDAVRGPGTEAAKYARRKGHAACDSAEAEGLDPARIEEIRAGLGEPEEEAE